jgi:hypothetical protein
MAVKLPPKKATSVLRGSLLSFTALSRVSVTSSGVSGFTEPDIVF